MTATPTDAPWRRSDRTTSGPPRHRARERGQGPGGRRGGKGRAGDDADVIAHSLDEPELFAGLYDRHAPGIHRYAARRLGEGSADDITAETFLIAFRTRVRYSVRRCLPIRLAAMPYSQRRASRWVVELRADAPVPYRAALAPGRALLTDAIAGRNHRARRLRADWRIASLGAVVAITAAALFITQVVDTPAPRPSAPATVAGDLDLSGPAAARGRAADFLERQEVPSEPRADQWIYLREVGGEPAQPTKKDGADSGMTVSVEKPDPDSWIPYDDKAAENDESDTDYRTARESYKIAADLPEDPEALLAELRKVFPTGSGPEAPPKPRTSTASAPCPSYWSRIRSRPTLWRASTGRWPRSTASR